MSRPKRTREQREIDLAEMPGLLRRGWTKARCAQKFGVSAAQVTQDWKEVQRRLDDVRNKDANALRFKSMEEIGEVKLEAWQAWEKSKEDAKSRSVTTEDFIGQDGAPYQKVKVVEAVEGRIPANQYLQTILSCIEQERKIEGIDKAKDGTDTGANMTLINWGPMFQGPPERTGADDLDDLIHGATGSMTSDQPPRIESTAP